MAQYDPTLTFFGCVCTADGEKALPLPFAPPACRLYGSGSAAILSRLAALSPVKPLCLLIDGVDTAQTAGLLFPGAAFCRVFSPKRATGSLTAFLPPDLRSFVREKEITAAALRRQAVSFLKAAQNLSRCTALLGEGRLKTEAITRYAARLFFREKGPLGRGTRPVFLSSVTGEGLQTLYSTVFAACPRLYAIEDDSGTVGPLLMRQLTHRLTASGQTGYLGLCPVTGRVQQLLLPDSGTAFLLANRWHPVDFPVYYRLHYSRFCRSDPLQATRSAYRTYFRGTEALLAEAVHLLKGAAACQREAEQAAASCLPLAEWAERLRAAQPLPHGPA